MGTAHPCKRPAGLLMKRRILMLDPDTNQAKVARLEALHAQYLAYVRLCVQNMLDQRVFNLSKSDRQTFFPAATHLTSQIEKNARDHAIAIVSTWAKGVYARKLKPTITNLWHEGLLTQDDAKALYIIGSKLLCEPWRFITQEHLDAYHALLDDTGGTHPQCAIPSR